MTLTDISRLRLKSQFPADEKLNSPYEIVSRMGAMQAQDSAMAKWGVGVRMNGATEQLIEAAIDKGEILRTHVLRPTWHLVSAEDIYRMLEISAPRIKASSVSRHKQLEITGRLLAKSHNLIVKALSQGIHLNREELAATLEQSGINTKDNRMAHFLMLAELDGIICSGKTRDKKHTYALLAERVPDKKNLSREEILATLAKKYFLSRYPATLPDFTWWSGLSAGDARQALNFIKPELVSETLNGQTYWFPGKVANSKITEDQVYLLPAFDEFLISYKDRSASLIQENHKKVISSYGMFWPTVIINGRVGGLWKRTIKKDRVILEVSLFTKANKAIKDLVENRAQSFGDFLGRKTENHFVRTSPRRGEINLLKKKWKK
ncbi:MAG: AlkZ family DNA glycosylase [Bacteroidales bacterium]|nr:AlkZ family DNA glycosylase [Bacteroidales bacterium]